MRVRDIGLMPLVAAICLAFVFSLAARPSAQATSVAQAAQQQGGRGGGRGGPGGPGRGGPPPTGRAGAPVDLAGTWVSVVTEDWLWRMVTPPKGDVTSVPVNAQGRKVADSWDPSQEGRCEAYGVGGLMRIPGRFRISWQDENTLKIESDAGQQTRLLHFAPPDAPVNTAVTAPRSLQGYSAAEWQRSGGAQDAFLGRGLGAGGAQRWGSLKVTTTNVLPAWLRKNGVPYSENAVITENFTRFTHPEAGDWLVITTTVDDPTYLQRPFITSTNFKKEANDSKFSPTPCRSS